MRRFHLIEIHEEHWCPKSVRDGVTDFLATAMATLDLYEPVRGRLTRAISESGASGVIDLCSGAGGPWPDWERRRLIDCSVTLTDKFPNISAQARLATDPAPRISYLDQPVDASAVPETLQGFRTLFTSFHHFRPAEARAILGDAVAKRQAVAIFEVTHRHWLAMLYMIGVPFAVWFLTPRIKNLSWKAIFFTYLVPLIPLVALVDGWTSCLRSYTAQEMRDMVESAGYTWTCGNERRARWGPPATYLIGVPIPSEPRP